MRDEDILVHIGGKLLDRPLALEDAQMLVPDWLPDAPFNDPPIPAAVLITLVLRPGGRQLLYTRRSVGLRDHSGQVSFPGGKIDAQDKDEGEAALREAHEEVGLEKNKTRILGYMQPYLTGTNFVITPVVAEVGQGAEFAPNPGEVDEVFEVPLSFVARQQNYSRFVVKHREEEHSTWQLDHGGHMIWGITANLTRNFCDLVLEGIEL